MIRQEFRYLVNLCESVQLRAILRLNSVVIVPLEGSANYEILDLVRIIDPLTRVLLFSKLTKKLIISIREGIRRPPRWHSPLCCVYIPPRETTRELNNVIINYDSPHVRRVIF